MVLWNLVGPGAVAASPPKGRTAVYTPPARVDATTAATLTATANELHVSVAITIQPTAAADVSGRVLTLFGQPVSGAEVRILGAGEATTDAAGAFTVHGVMAPYDLLVHGLQSFYAYYPGLRRRDPTAMLPLHAVWDQYQVAASGQVSGGQGFPPPAGYQTRVALGSPDLALLMPHYDDLFFWVRATGDGAYGYLFAPVTAPETDATLHALEWQSDAAGLPLEFTGHASRAVHLLSGVPVDGQHMILAATPGATAHVSGTVASHAGALHLRGQARLGDARMLLFDDPAPAASFRYATPALADELQLTLTVGDTGEQAWDLLNGFNLGAHRGRLPPEASGVALALVAPPNPNVPPDGATVTSADQVFGWQLMGAASPVYVAVFAGGVPYEPSSGFTAAVVTTAPSVSAALLSELGISIPRDATFQWWVFGTTAASTVDQAAGPDGFLLRADSYVWGRSPAITFHTPP